MPPANVSLQKCAAVRERSERVPDNTWRRAVSEGGEAQLVTEDAPGGHSPPAGGDARRDAGPRERRFTELYEAHGRYVLAWALRRVPRSDAQDLLSETFAVCWRRLDDVPAGDAARPWLYGVTARLLANQLRGRRRHDRLVYRLQGNEGTSQARSGIDGADLDDVRIERLEAAMGRLRPSDAEILRLSAWEGLGPSELAVALECSANAAAIRLHRARRALSFAYNGLRPPSGGTT